MKREKWVWMPHHGHFICGRNCGFHLNTYVGKYIVSTVGEYKPRGSGVGEDTLKGVPKKYRNWFKEQGFDIIGFTRFYETMVFKAKKDKDNGCCPWVASDFGHELDFIGYNDPESAYKGHLKLCQKWSKENR